MAALSKVNMSDIWFTSYVCKKVSSSMSCHIILSIYIYRFSAWFIFNGNQILRLFWFIHVDTVEFNVLYRTINLHRMEGRIFARAFFFLKKWNRTEIIIYSNICLIHFCPKKKPNENVIFCIDMNRLRQHHTQICRYSILTTKNVF